jgi:L-Ala-D/L-Glu epimerase
MTLRVTPVTVDLRLAQPFSIARRHDDGRPLQTVVVTLEDPALPGLVGYGEGFPSRYYGETPATVTALLPVLAAAVGKLEPTPAGLERAASAMESAVAGNGAAKCALDTALHDLAAKAQGCSVVELLGLSTQIPPTDFSLGLDAPEQVAERARKVTRFPALKIKLGGSADVETLRAVRGVFAGPIRVDANTGWSADEAATLLDCLEQSGVELVEQPFAADQVVLMAALQRRTSIPLVADESAVDIGDLAGLAGSVAGVNVKLAKCGGIGPALRMLRRARELGLRTMLGCMEETSLGIAASATVASLAEWVDLDGNLLLADDPFGGLELDDACRWRIGKGLGLGVWPR